MISSGLGHEALVSHSPNSSISGPLLPDPDPPGFSFGKYLILLPGCGVGIFVFGFETEELELFFFKLVITSYSLSLLDSAITITALSSLSEYLKNKRALFTARI